MRSQLPRLLIGFVSIAVSWLSPATRAAPPASAPTASRSPDECIAAMARSNWPLGERESDVIETLAKAFPLSDEDLGQLLNLAQGYPASASQRATLATIAKRASAIGASGPARGRTPEQAALAQDQILFLRVVVEGSSLLNANLEWKSPQLRASAGMATEPFAVTSSDRFNTTPDVARFHNDAALLAECEASGVKELWTRDWLSRSSRWQRESIFEVVRDRLHDSPYAPPTLMRAMVLAAAGN